MAIYCCKGCVAPKRHPGCHSHCPEYIAGKAKHDEEKAAADRRKYIEGNLTGQTLKGVNIANRSRRQAKGRSG